VAVLLGLLFVVVKSQTSNVKRQLTFDA